MPRHEQTVPLRFALIGLLIAVIVVMMIEMLVFEGDLQRAIVPAGGIGVGVGISFHVLKSRRM